MRSSDKPITSASEDSFSRNDFAKQISDIIASRDSSDSLVIGIYGRWGEGKTSVLNLLQNELQFHQNIITIKFNPWYYKDQPKILELFFENIASTIGKTVSLKEKLGKWQEIYIKPFAAFFHQKDTFEAINNFLLSVDIDEKKKEINKHLQKVKKKFVVLIDDIDRLDNDEIFLLFKLIKMNLDFYNTVFILAFDYDMVTSALSSKYSDNNNGANFIEKIIQVPLNLPLISIEKLQEFCFHQIDEMLQKEEIIIQDDEIQRFQYGFTPGLSIRLSTPRVITRYINVLSIYIPLLKNEVNINDLMLIEGLRICYPQMYDLIKRNKDVFLFKDWGYTQASESERENIRQRVMQLINIASSQYIDYEKIALEKLLTVLFPQLNQILKNNIFSSYDSKEIIKNKRIASDYYFPRYFQYSIPENDISDSAISEFLQSLDVRNLPLHEYSKKLQNIISKNNADVFIRKLILWSEKFSINISKNLALVLAMNGDLFPKQRNDFVVRSTFSQSARLIVELISHEKNKKMRLSLSKRILTISKPLPYSVEIMRGLKFSANSDIELFTNEEIERFNYLLIQKISKSSQESDLFKEYPDEIGMLLNYWQSGIKSIEVEDYFKAKTKSNVKHITVFLSSLLGVYFGSSGIGRADLTQENYDVIKRIIDPAYIVSKLEELYGKTIYSEEFPNHRLKIDLDLRTAKQFVYFYKHPKEDNKVE